MCSAWLGSVNGRRMRCEAVAIIHNTPCRAVPYRNNIGSRQSRKQKCDASELAWLEAFFVGENTLSESFKKRKKKELRTKDYKRDKVGRLLRPPSKEEDREEEENYQVVDERHRDRVTTQ